MGGARLRSSVACLILMVRIHMFYEETIHAHALGNQTTTLRIGVLWKRYFRELVSAGKNGTNPTGFCVEAFKKAIEPLNLTVEYITYGNGVDPPPSYDELIQLIVDKEIDTRSVMGRMVVVACLVVAGILYSCYTANLSAILTAPRLEPTLNSTEMSIPILILFSRHRIIFFISCCLRFQEIDAVVGDMTITLNRSQKVEFTQPFLGSGLVAVVRLKDESFMRSALVFMKPFTTQLWLLIAAFFVCGGLAVYLLERRKNPPIRGKPASRRCGEILMYSFSTWFPNLEDTRSVMGRTVGVACLVVTGILYSCYTANLSAILTAPRLEPTLNDIHSVVARQDIKIAYWNNSFMGDLLRNDLNIIEQRLINLTTRADYYKSLSSGGEVAVIDERPYMQSLVANYCSSLAFAGQPFTTLNWGFAFDKIHHQLVANISSRILQLTESGELYRIQNDWLPYYESYCSKQPMSSSSQLHVRQFWGLFAISGLVTVILLMLNVARSRGTDSGASRRRRFIQLGRRAWPSRLSRSVGTTSENSGFEDCNPPDASERPAV